MADISLKQATQRTRELLDQVKKSSTAKQLADISDNLIDVKRKLPWTSGFKPLRSVIKDTITDLHGEVTDQVLRNLEERGRLLDDNTEHLSQSTAENESNAAVLRLEKITAVLDATKEAADAIADAIKSVKDSLDSKNYEEAGQKIETALKELNDIKDALS